MVRSSYPLSALTAMGVAADGLSGCRACREIAPSGERLGSGNPSKTVGWFTAGGRTIAYQGPQKQMPREDPAMRTIPRHRRDLIDRLLRTFGRDFADPAAAASYSPSSAAPAIPSEDDLPSAAASAQFPPSIAAVTR